MKELVFEVTQEEDGGYCAECLTENIFTQADRWDELHSTDSAQSPTAPLKHRRHASSAPGGSLAAGPKPAEAPTLRLAIEIICFVTGRAANPEDAMEQKRAQFAAFTGSPSC